MKILLLIAIISDQINPSLPNCLAGSSYLSIIKTINSNGMQINQHSLVVTKYQNVK